MTVEELIYQLSKLPSHVDVGVQYSVRETYRDYTDKGNITKVACTYLPLDDFGDRHKPIVTLQTDIVIHVDTFPG